MKAETKGKVQHAILLACVMMLGVHPVTALADNTPEGYEMSLHCVIEDESGYTSDELFAAYAQRVFDEALGIQPLGDKVSRLRRTSALQSGTLEKEIYDTLKARLEGVSDGTSNSTTISVTPTASWSLADLGVTSFISDGKLTPEASEAISSKLSLIYTCLLADCPWELYWHDKTPGNGGVSFSYSCSVSDGRLHLPNFTCRFAVAKDYSADNTVGTYVTDTEKTGAASAAATNAKAIVDENAGKSDLEKLAAYKDKICQLVSYNSDAAVNSSTTMEINPWQMIYVFDNNANTNVVCEGYAKAFQYLCDLSFADTDCIKSRTGVRLEMEA